MPHQRPTCPIGDQHTPSETDMPHRRPTCLWRPIRDQHACRVTMEFMYTWKFKYTYFYILLTYLYTYWSPMGCHSGMSVSDGSLMKHVKGSDGYLDGYLIWLGGPQRVSNKACPSPMGLLIRHVSLWWVSNRSPVIIKSSWTPDKIQGYLILWPIYCSIKKNYIKYLSSQIYETYQHLRLSIPALFSISYLCT